jgi:tRNA(fMet)-specific endonuclease VapC
MMRLLDTDIASHVLEGNPHVIQRLRSLDDPAVYTTVITRVEMLRGCIEFLLKATADQVLKAQQWLRTTDEFLGEVRIIPMDEPAVEVFERLQKTKGLKKIGHADLLIASIALAQKAILVTGNTRHFQLIPSLKLENWID